MTLTAFIRRWKNSASYVRPPDGAMYVTASGTNPLPDEAKEAFARITNRDRPPATDPEPFADAMPILARTATHWRVGSGVLDAVHGDGKRLVKFSWEPRTGETLLIPPGQQHASVEGEHPFDDYLRGIVLHEQRIIALRPYWPASARASVYAGFGPDDAERSYDAQAACERALLQAHPANPSEWTYRYNITNPALEELTGIPAGRW